MASTTSVTDKNYDQIVNDFIHRCLKSATRHPHPRYERPNRLQPEVPKNHLVRFGETTLILFVLSIWLLSVFMCVKKFKKLRGLHPTIPRGKFNVRDLNPANISNIKIIKNASEAIIYKKGPRNASNNFKAIYINPGRSQSLPIGKEYISVSSYTLLNNDINPIQNVPENNSPVHSRKSNHQSFNNSLKSNEGAFSHLQTQLPSNLMIKRKSFARSRINYLDWYVTKDNPNKKLVYYTFEGQSVDWTDLSGTLKNTADVSTSLNNTPSHNRKKKSPSEIQNLLRPEMISNTVAKNLIMSLGDSRRRLSSSHLERKISRSESNLKKAKIDCKNASRMLKIFSLGDGNRLLVSKCKSITNACDKEMAADKIHKQASMIDDVF